MKLVIVESPTKAKTLSSILPKKDYIIEASMGHIRDLPKSGLGVDVENNFEPEYVVPPKAKKTISLLKNKSKDVEEIILATDPDREGEAIAWHLKYLLQQNEKKTRKKSGISSEKGDDKNKKSDKKFGRVSFHELTESAVEEAFKNLGDINMNLVNAQQARRILDRLVGYKLSPLLWKKVMYGLSAGRVQSVAVRLIVERERERLDFKAEEYWTMKGLFSSISDYSDKKEEFEAQLIEKSAKKIKIPDKKSAEEIEKDLKDDSFVVSSVKKMERKNAPYPPLNTSTLQQAMSNLFGFTAKRTMAAAQSLFEQGYITYHRTDSLNLSPSFVAAARDFIQKEFGTDYLPKSPIFYKTKSKNAQEAHEAIRPTNVLFVPGKGGKKLKSDEMKVYSVIWKRSVECQMNSAIYDQTMITVSSEKGYVFKAVGSRIKFDGWFAVGKLLKISQNESDGEENILSSVPNVSEKEKVNLKAITSEQHFTQPPARYSDATLIKKMEELGVGRPSTYAPTISTIQVRGYVEKEGRYFVPRDVAYVVNDLLVEHFPNIVDYGFTAEMEQNLDEIALGEKEWVSVIRNFYEPFEKELIEKEEVLNKKDVTNLGYSDEKCPECGKPLVFKLGRYGKFLSCSGYPECKYAKPISDSNGSEEEKDVDYGKCPNCEDGVFVLKQGRFGKFLACSNYPKCKTTKNYMDKIGIKCPKCGEGDVVIKKAKGRVFYGCSRYPECNWSSWKNPMPKEEKSPKSKRETLQSLI
jgi:DNA topoisomerase-1